jgi:hypothetical protein
MDGKIRLDGYYTPAPHTEGKAGMELDFDDAKWLLRDLQKALDDMPCPSCGRCGKKEKV